MDRWVYALLDLGTLVSAIGMGLYWKQRWIYGWRRTLMAIGIVSVFFWLWDIVAADVGQWDFSERYTLGVAFLGLPIEEYAFFVVVGLAALAIWQRVTAITPGRRISPLWLMVPVGIALAMNMLWLGNVYTFAVAGVVYITCIVLLLMARSLLTISWVYFQLILFALFFAFNSILTTLPIVTYDPGFFSNVRVGAIPLEDFLYNFALINLVIATYAYLGRSPSRYL